MRKVLLADPLFLNHSLLYYQAALASSGFEETRFTIATSLWEKGDRGRLTEFCQTQPRVTLRLLDINPGDCDGRWACWKGFGRAMRATEGILREESFDLVAYLMLDLVMVYFALPSFRPGLRAHYQARIAGIVFRDNGLRPPLVNSLKARMRTRMDRWILRRALAGGGLRKAAFLDHWCADRARESFKSDICGYGVDPVVSRPWDVVAARAQFGLKPEDFVFLLFGTLSDRKGIIESLAALREASLPKEKTVILVAGPTDTKIQQRLSQELEATGRTYRVIRHDRFIKEAELPPYFAAADCVVCVYKEFSGSSSVLLHGASYGKPAIVSAGGVMDDAVRRHSFGEVVRCDDLKGFARAARKLATLGTPERQAMAPRALSYAASMDAARFMSQFL